MLTMQLSCHFEKGYIGNPYWPEIARVIDIQKQSGMNRAKSTPNRRKALEEHLRSLSMTMADYEALEHRAAQPFYMDGAQIVIPENHVLSFLVATCDEIRSAQRPCDAQQVRSRFIATPWATGKEKPDGIWERFATVTSGTGQKLSNQRGLRSSPYISNFTASGTLSFDVELVDKGVLEKAIAWGGAFVGIGASRKMGWGRFTVTEFSPAPT